MKILAISLLRLGDLAMHSIVISRLQKMHPAAEIHLLTNRGNSQLAEILGIQKVHIFEREKIQSSMKSAECSIFEAFDRTTDLIRRLNKENFTHCINLTHNGLSARISGFIQCDEKQGLTIFPDLQNQIGNSWFRHLNDYSLSGGTHQFHFVDLLTCATGSDSTEIDTLELSSRDSDQAGRSIAFQPWSSEDQKDWLDDCWIQLAERLRKYSPQHEIQVLHHSSNARRAEALVRKAGAAGVQLQLVCLELAELATEIQSRCDLLISVDTGIKHFGALLGVKTLELSLGTTDLYKTGVYQAGAIILRPKVSTLDADAVAAIAFEHLRNDKVNLIAIAEEFADSMHVFRVAIFKHLGFFPVPLASDDMRSAAHKFLEMLAFRHVLQKEPAAHIQPLATLALQFRDFWRQLPQRILDFDMSAFLRSAESISLACENEVRTLKKQILVELQAQKSLAGESFAISAELGIRIRNLEKDMQLGSYLTQFIGNSVSFYSLRRVISALDDLAEVQKSIWKIIRNFEQTKQLEF